MSVSSASFDAAAVKLQLPGLGNPQLHYLDSAATEQMPEAVPNALQRFELEARVNVHDGKHRRARAATDAYQEASARVARVLNAWSDQEMVFTYGATSSIDLLAHCFGTLLGRGDGILLSILEHHGRLVPWQRLAKQTGVVLRFLPMMPAGRTPRCWLVALAHCSNVTGAMTDVGQGTAAARTVGAKVLLGGAQRAPPGPVDARRLDVDFYAFSGDKTDRPSGTGFGAGASCLTRCRRS